MRKWSIINGSRFFFFLNPAKLKINFFSPMPNVKMTKKKKKMKNFNPNFQWWVRVREEKVAARKKNRTKWPEFRPVDARRSRSFLTLALFRLLIFQLLFQQTEIKKPLSLSTWERKRFISTSSWLDMSIQENRRPPDTWSTSAVELTSVRLRNSRRRPRR